MSAILLSWTQSFCYSELNHFFAIVLSHLIFQLLHYSAIPHCYIDQSLVFYTVLSHFLYYNAYSFLITILLSHFSLIRAQSFLMLQCSVIHHCYNTKSFFTAKCTQSFLDPTVINHFLLLQCLNIPRCYNVSGGACVPQVISIIKLSPLQCVRCYNRQK
jgi:hypothetical protein